MKNLLPLFLLLSTQLFFTFSFAQRKIVIMGSSTAAGASASSYDSAWAGRLQAYFRQNTSPADADTIVINISAYGYTTYHEMPTGFISPVPNRPAPDTGHNVTKALSYSPDIVIINLPSNDVASLDYPTSVPLYTTKETIDNFRKMFQAITATGAKCFITTSQPRNDLTDVQRQEQRSLVDSINNSFGVYAVDFWTDLVTPDGTNRLRNEVRHIGYADSPYHLNNYGHTLLFQRVKAKNIFSTSGPVPGSYAAVPGKIEAENWAAMNGVATENTLDAGGGLDVGWIDTGDWIDYNVNVTAAGNYTVSFRIATPNVNEQFQLRKADGTILATVSVPVTSGYQTWQTISAGITLAQGNQTVRIYSLTSGWNINWLQLATAISTPPPVYTSVPGRIEAENWAGMSGVATENTLDAGGGLDVGWIDNGDWIDYNVNATAAGNYTLTFRVATPNTGAQFQVRRADGTVLATVNVPQTGGYQNWQACNATLSLAAGQQTLRIISTATSGWNINWIDFQLPPATTTTIHVEAENWAAMSGVATENTLDAGGGLDVGWIDYTDWMDYSINPGGGSYTVNFRVASPNTSAQLQLRKADGTVLATLNVPNTGGYQTWQTISATVSLTAGPQTVRIISTGGGGWNINWIDFTGGSSPPPPPVSSTIHIEAENYAAMSGVQKETTLDAGGGLDVGWIDYTDWMDYAVTVATSGSYTARFRVASPNSNAQLELRKADGTTLSTVNLPNTGGYQNWQTVTVTVSLPAGLQTLRVVSTGGGGWNFNWMEFVLPATATLLPGRNLSSEEPANPLHIDKLFIDGSTLFATVSSKKKQDAIVSIISISGTVLSKQTKPLGFTTNFNLPVSTLPGGNYLLSITTADGEHTVKKFVRSN